MADMDTFNFSDKKVLVRVDFNVPFDSQFHITDDTRIKASLPTINKILAEGGSVILMSHLGRPKAGYEEKFSLSHLVAHLSKLLKVNVRFATDCIGPEAERAARELQTGDVLLLENLRFHPQEEKGDKDFARALAGLGDAYVNDAFGTAHRAHASTAVIAQFFDGNKMFGFLMADEINNAEHLLHNAKHPFTAILGGAKVSDKILIIENLMEKVDHMVIGGGMAFTFIKGEGGNIGSSLLEADKVEYTTMLKKKAADKKVSISLPADAVAADKFANDANTQICEAANIPDGWMGLDIGPDSVKRFCEVIRNSKTILWNGPMGVFEMSNFANGTKEVAHAIAEATSAGAYSLIGGGDSAAAINKFGLANQVSYVSTGGGALLEFIEGKELPGIRMMMEN